MAEGVYRLFPGQLLVHHGHGLAVLADAGGIRDEREGFYVHRTRFLSALAVTLNGAPPRCVASLATAAHAAVGYYLAAAAEGEAVGPGEIADKAIELQLDWALEPGQEGLTALALEMTLTNHALAPVRVDVALRLDADYADEGEVRDGRRRQTAPVDVGWDGAVLRFDYRHPALPHGTDVVPTGDAAWRDGHLRWHLVLAPQAPTRVGVRVAPRFLGAPFAALPPGTADRRRAAWLAGASRLVTPNAGVQATWDRAVEDLGALRLHHAANARANVPAAGIPYYQALFGRDSLTAAWQAGLASPAMLRGTIESMAAHLGSHVDDRHDEQPGRVIHQREHGPLAALGLTPYGAYYGDYAGPGMFLVALAWDFAMTGDRDFQRRLRPAADAVLDWMDRDGDRDGDGFYEYATRAGATRNQGWKDSEEAILDPLGRPVGTPLAPVEIQGYYYAAKQLTGLVRLALGDVAAGTRLLAEAQDLKRRFNAAFWLPDLRCYALALGPSKAPVATVASNAAQLLATGIVDADKAAALAGRMMAPDMFSGWGIRTLSSAHPAYNPFAYHLGAVWPSENGSIALGLKRYGFTHHVADLAKGLFDLAAAFEGHRPPEAVGGHARDRAHPHPGIYPDACAPQAWSASAMVMLVQALTGVVPLAPVGLVAVDPALPAWLPELKLEGLAVGGHRIDLRFRRDASGHTDWDAKVGRGGPRVVRQSAPENRVDGVFDRIGGLLAGLIPF